MPRVKYYYDTETCEYVKARPTVGSVVKKLALHLATGAAICALFYLYLAYFNENPAIRRLKTDNEEMLHAVDGMKSELAMLEQELENLHQKDVQVYRTILNKEPIGDNVWSAPTGGAQEEELRPASLQETQERLEKVESKVRIQHQSYSALLARFKEREEELKHIPSIRPVKGGVISGFGLRKHPILKIRKMHTGLDFQAAMGTPVYATGDGTIDHTGSLGNGYGLSIDVNHGYGYVSKYAHLSKSLVKPGQKVRRGELIGFTGNSGLSKGPHLHYEIIKKGDKIDPVDYFYSDLTPEAYIDFKQQARQDSESMD